MKSKMVNWGALIEAPIGLMLLYVALAMYNPLQDPLFSIIGNSEAFPHGATIKIIVQLIPLILGVMFLYSSYRGFREPESPQYAMQ